MSFEDVFRDLDPRFDEPLEAEMERLLSERHGLSGVRVCVDRKIGRWTCSRDVCDEVFGAVLAQAVKNVIIQRVRDAERRRDE